MRIWNRVQPIKRSEEDIILTLKEQSTEFNITIKKSTFKRNPSFLIVLQFVKLMSNWHQFCQNKGFRSGPPFEQNLQSKGEFPKFNHLLISCCLFHLFMPHPILAHHLAPPHLSASPHLENCLLATHLQRSDTIRSKKVFVAVLIYQKIAMKSQRPTWTSGAHCLQIWGGALKNIRARHNLYRLIPLKILSPHLVSLFHEYTIQLIIQQHSPKTKQKYTQNKAEEVKH